MSHLPRPAVLFVPPAYADDATTLRRAARARGADDVATAADLPELGRVVGGASLILAARMSRLGDLETVWHVLHGLGPASTTQVVFLEQPELPQDVATLSAMIIAAIDCERGARRARAAKGAKRAAAKGKAIGRPALEVSPAQVASLVEKFGGSGSRRRGVPLAAKALGCSVQTVRNKLRDHSVAGARTQKSTLKLTPSR